MADRRPRLPGWLATVIAFVLAVPIAAVTASVVFEALKAGAPGAEPPRTLLAEYDPPATGVPALPVAILGPDEERVSLPTLSYAQIEALGPPPTPVGTSPSAPSPAAEPTSRAPGETTEPGASPAATAGVTDPPSTGESPSVSATASPTDPPVDVITPPPDDGESAPGIELDIDSRPAAIEVMTDLCMLHGRVPGCPDGIPGTIIGELPPPPDFGAPAEIGFSDFALSALVNHDPGAPEYAEFADGGCAPPGDGGVSLLILTREIIRYDVSYWPILFLPDGDVEPSEMGTTSGNTIFERDAVPYRYYHCPRLLVGEEVLFEVQIRLTDGEGDVAWPPVYEFCLDCRTAPQGERLRLSSGYAVELHPDWAAGILYAPPADGALEFAYRLQGGRWLSRLNTSVRQHEEARVRTPPNLLAGRRYEYQLRLWPLDGGPVYESEISFFDTLRWRISVQANRFYVADEGDGDFRSIALWLCGSPHAAYSGPDCTERQGVAEIDVVGRDTIGGGLFPSGIDVREADILEVTFESGNEFVLEATRSSRFYVRLDTLDLIGETCYTSGCQWFGYFEVPPYFEARPTECIPDVNAFVVRTSPIARGYEPSFAYFVGEGDGPLVTPTQLNVCVRQVP